MFYDANNIQLSTTVEDVDSEDVAAKYKAWNWNVLECNGNSAESIREALREALKEGERPTLIIGKTIMGLGAMDANGGSFENKISTHGQPISAAGADPARSIENLGGDSENPFVIFPEVKALYDARR